MAEHLHMPREDGPLPGGEPILPLESLPHWARVAFAARCARRVLPLIAEHWPDAAAERRLSVQRAIELAEQAAAAAHAADGLDDAAAAAAAVGSIALHGGEPNEPVPKDGNAATIASYVAKTAEYSARTARAEPGDSLAAASAALAYAFQATEGEGEECREQIRHDLARLQVAAIRLRWNDRTPVSAELADSLPDPDPPQTRGIAIIDVCACIVLSAVTLSLLPKLPPALSALAGLLAIYTAAVGILIGARHAMAPPLYLGVWLSYIALALALLTSVGWHYGPVAAILGSLWALYFNYPEVRDSIRAETNDPPPE